MARHLARCTVGLVAAVALLLTLAGPGFAGDGGTVTVELLPATPDPGQSVTFHFIVFTHGRPIDFFGDKPVRPYLVANNRATGESLRVEGYKDGDLGHFAADVTFPSAGTWNLRIKAEPLMLGTWTGSLAVGSEATHSATVKAEALGWGTTSGAMAAGSILSVMGRR